MHRSYLQLKPLFQLPWTCHKPKQRLLKNSVQGAQELPTTQTTLSAFTHFLRYALRIAQRALDDFWSSFMYSVLRWSESLLYWLYTSANRDFVQMYQQGGRAASLNTMRFWLDTSSKVQIF